MLYVKVSSYLGMNELVRWKKTQNLSLLSHPPPKKESPFCKQNKAKQLYRSSHHSNNKQTSTTSQPFVSSSFFSLTLVKTNRSSNDDDDIHHKRPRIRILVRSAKEESHKEKRRIIKRTFCWSFYKSPSFFK